MSENSMIWRTISLAVWQELEALECAANISEIRFTKTMVTLNGRQGEFRRLADHIGILANDQNSPRWDGNTDLAKFQRAEKKILDAMPDRPVGEKLADSRPGTRLASNPVPTQGVEPELIGTDVDGKKFFDRPGATDRPDIDLLIRCLGHYTINARLLGTLEHQDGLRVFECSPNPANPLVREWWYICDNGGEFNVRRINDTETRESIPYTATDTGVLCYGTMCYRVAQFLAGEPIDFAYREDPELNETLVHLVWNAGHLAR